MTKTSLICLALFAFVACNEQKNTAAVTDSQQVAEAKGVAYTVDSASTLTWKGSKPTGTHTGTFNLSGELLVDGPGVTGGTFTIDIASLKNHDLTENDGKSKLEGHLKSPDFFDVARFPIAKFEITSVKPDSAGTHLVSGNLTLKDSTKNISFPASIVVDENSVAAKAEFSIDRTMWGMNYKGPNNPQDWFIRKDVKIILDLIARKK